MPRYRATISGQNDDVMADLIRKYKINVFHHRIHHVQDIGYAVDAIVDDEQIRMLEASGYQVTRHEDVDEAGKARQREVGQGNRYKLSRPQ
jgi:hypothetical protein